MAYFRILGVSFAFLVVAGFAIAAPVQAHDNDDHERRFVASLSGNEEVPIRDTPAGGRAQFRLSEDGTQLAFRVTVRRITNVFAAHIHCGTPGVIGPPGVTLFTGAPGGGPFSGVLAKGVKTAPDSPNGCGWANLAAVIAALESGKTYVNVHTNAGGTPPKPPGPGNFPGGEIRGHPVTVLEDEEDGFVAKLSGANEVPARDTPARGRAVIRLNEDGTELHFKIRVRDISNVFKAHIHCAAAGVNGPIGVTLYGDAPTGMGPLTGLLVKAMTTGPDKGNDCKWSTLADVIAAMRAGTAYVNVHTNDGMDGPNTGPGDFPGGEIRGQIVPEDDD